MSLPIRVVSVDQNNQGYDLSERITGLSWTNVNPGGDETCSFTLWRPWMMSSPEVDRGNSIRVEAGLDVLWSGRVGDTARTSDESETMQVTCYGNGAKLKDEVYAEIYCDRDLNSWRSMSAFRKSLLYLTGAGSTRDMAVEEDVGAAIPSLALRLDNGWTNSAYCEAWYDTGWDEVGIGSVILDWATRGMTTAGSFSFSYGYADSDVSPDNSTAMAGATFDAASGDELTIDGAGQQYVFLQVVNTITVGVDADRYWKGYRVRVYGTHGLAKGPAGGFTADQIVGDAIGRVPGIVARRIDPQTFEIEHLVYQQAVYPEDVINDVDSYEHCDWGTWGPDGPFVSDDYGYFQYTSPEAGVQHWIGYRADFENLDLNSELSSLYDTVVLKYTDAAGSAKTITATRTIEALEDAGQSGRSTTIDGGTLSDDSATNVCNVILAIMAQGAPARGSATIVKPLTHYRYGQRGPEYMRADGSNLRIPDVLPTSTLFDLSNEADRRTTFPIKRVTVSVDSMIQAQVEVDQENDLLSTLQARLQARAQDAAR